MDEVMDKGIEIKPHFRDKLFYDRDAASNGTLKWLKIIIVEGDKATCQAEKSEKEVTTITKPSLRIFRIIDIETARKILKQFWQKKLDEKNDLLMEAENNLNTAKSNGSPKHEIYLFSKERVRVECEVQEIEINQERIEKEINDAKDKIA